MNWFGNHPYERPFPELLAAYADGELDAAGRAWVEAWLADHPDARAELEAQRELSRHNRELWQAGESTPSEATWTQLFGRVQFALAAPSQPPTHRPLRIFGTASAAAAAILFAVLLVRPTPPGPPPAQPAAAAWAVASNRDVEIVSMQDADTDRLVVGQPPLTRPIALAAAGDVTFEKVQADTDGMMPQMPQPGTGVPMVVAPVGDH